LIVFPIGAVGWLDNADDGTDGCVVEEAGREVDVEVCADVPSPVTPELFN